MRIIAFGYVSLFEKTGQYQFYVQLLEPSGKGGLYLAFEQLKTSLAAQGLFDETHKKKIPPYPRCIALITAGSGAAVQDMIQIARRRNPLVDLVVIPCLVQGEKAAEDIVRAIQIANRWGRADCIILGRGGGSLEDLQPFNEEAVARAIFASQIPIVSAVGHETDFTISDLTADLRAPTPSAAAELVVPLLSDLKADVEFLRNKLHETIEGKLAAGRQKLSFLQGKKVMKDPLVPLYNRQVYIHSLQIRMHKEINHQMKNASLRFARHMDALEALSPLAVLKRGYTLVYNEQGQTISHVSQLSRNQNITIDFHNGRVKAVVDEIQSAEDPYGKEEDEL